MTLGINQFGGGIKVPKVSLPELIAHVCPLTQLSGTAAGSAMAEAKGSLHAC